MIRVAIPIEKGILSKYFAECNHYEIFGINDGQIISNEILYPSSIAIEQMPEWAAQQDITDIITHRIEKSIIRMFAQYRINLFVGLDQTNPQILIKKYIEGSLQSNTNIINEIIYSDEK